MVYGSSAGAIHSFRPQLVFQDHIFSTCLIVALFIIMFALYSVIMYSSLCLRFIPLMYSSLCLHFIP